MRCFVVLSVALLICSVPFAHAKPDPNQPELNLEAGPALANPFEAPAAKSRVDTTFILGGPDRWDGSFETPGGQADWHGWTGEDPTSDVENHWHVSTYWAYHLDGHGPGNHALYNGDESLPSCAPSDTLGGTGNNWFDDVEWSQTVADPSQPVTVRLTGIMTYDLRDETWDFLELFIKRGNELDMLASWTGTDENTVTIDFTTVFLPGEFTGPGGDEVVLRWRVWTDGAWSDEDCFAPGHGACQIDDLSVFFDETLITFDDFEPGNPVNWNPVQFAGVGNFTNLRNDLGDVDPCKDNLTWQVNFIDDGMVVPELDGTPCVDWCYDPGGWILNNTGGLQADDPRDWFLENQVVSPPIAYPPGLDGAQLDFNVYRHETRGVLDDAGMFYFWQVRSTDSSDPADLAESPWRSQGLFFYGGPDFKRHEEGLSDLLVEDRQWVQVALGVSESGWQVGLNGVNGTPAPYFDNVSLKIWDPVGPGITPSGFNLFGDAVPATGILSPANLAANSCRVDMAGVTFNGQRGDTLVVKVKPLRHGATVVPDPVLHWVMDCNPVFDSVRTGSPDGDGLLRGMTSGTPTQHGTGWPLADHWTFDLADEGFFFPGDRLRYYILASDDLNGDLRTAVWPPDTTGVADFTAVSVFPRVTEIRGLPSVTQPVAGQFDQPALLVFDDTDNSEAAQVWFEALEALGFEPGVGFDVVTLDRMGSDISMYRTMPLGIFHGYQTMIYARGNQVTGSLFDEDAEHISFWLELGNKQALMAGDGVGYDLLATSSSWPLMDQLGVQFHGRDIYALNGGQRELQISPVPGGGVLPDQQQWQVYDGCPVVRYSSAISATGNGVNSATLDPEGTTGGAYAALVTVDDLVFENRTAVMPIGLDRVDGMTAGSVKSSSTLSPQANLLGRVLFWLGADVSHASDDVPGLGRLSVTAHPNPFNPQTTIAFELPRSLEVSLDIFDLQGRVVRSLLQSTQHAAGRHQQVWDGRDTDGMNTASGVYFFRLKAGDQERVGKLTLLK